MGGRRWPTSGTSSCASSSSPASMSSEMGGPEMAPQTPHAPGASATPWRPSIRRQASGGSALLPPISSAYAERESERDGWIERAVHRARGVAVRHARRAPQWGRLVAGIADCSRALGLRVGLVVHGLAPDERRTAYACDITYVTNKEIAFDYLRDRITLRGHPSRLQLQLERLGGSDARVRRLLLRGLVYAIVDEARSVLGDEARTPLIISGAGDDAPDPKLYATTLEIAAALTRPPHFALSRPHPPIKAAN